MRAPFSQQLQEAARFIQENDRFLVISHVNPDGDAIGSTCSMACMLDKLGKSFVMVNEDRVSKRFTVIPRSDQIVGRSEQGLPEGFQAVIAVDSADFDRIGQTKALLSEGTPILNIDHHPTNDGWGSVSLIREDAASTTEVLFALCQELQIPLDEELATCLYAGLMTDTGGFRFSNTTVAVMRTAADLMEAGVNATRLSEGLMGTMTKGQVELLKHALQTMEYASEGRIAWISIKEEEIAELVEDPTDTEGLVNYPRSIQGVEVGLMFKQVDSERVKVSLRSKDVDVSAIAQSFGGGGHVKASGCTFQGSLEDAVSQVVRKVQEAL
jgi:phosphoesterase RecJ-like protein